MKRTVRTLWLPALVAAGLFASTASAEIAPLQEKKTEERKPPEKPPSQWPKRVDDHARSVAEKVAHFERVYRDRMARLRRLTTIYEKQGNADKIAEVRALQAALEKRHANAMKGFRADLGEDHWARLQKELGPPTVRAPARPDERPRKDAPKDEAPKREERKEERPKEKPPGGGR